MNHMKSLALNCEWPFDVTPLAKCLDVRELSAHGSVFGWRKGMNECAYNSVSSHNGKYSLSLQIVPGRGSEEGLVSGDL